MPEFLYCISLFPHTGPDNTYENECFPGLSNESLTIGHVFQNDQFIGVSFQLTREQQTLFRIEENVPHLSMTKRGGSWKGVG